VLVVTLAAAGAAGAPKAVTSIALAAPMTAGEETPSPAGDVSAARGSFAATATKSEPGATLSWRLTFSGLTGPATAAHIHTGPKGQAGPVVVPLCGPCESGASGTATITAAVLDAIQTGGAYANVHTNTNKGGEIRGQVAVQASLNASLRPGQEVPRPKGKVRRARATFAGTVTKLGDSATLSWRLTFSGLTGRALAAHIHVGRRGKAGPVAVSLCGPCRNGARGTADLNASVLTALQAGRAYVNVHTKRNKGGEVRGQLPVPALTLS
jgi:hypothetical protein